MPRLPRARRLATGWDCTAGAAGKQGAFGISDCRFSIVECLPRRSRAKPGEYQAANAEVRMPGRECRMPNAECRTENALRRHYERLEEREWRSTNAKCRMPNACHGVALRSRAERRTPYGVTASGWKSANGE